MPTDGQLPLRALVLDTETTGISKKDVVIQLGYVYGSVTQEGSFRVVEIREDLWKPLESSRGDAKAVPMNPRAESVHGIPSDLCMHEGKNPAVQIRGLISRLKRLSETGSAALVAHNLSFDRRMLMQTASRHGLEHELKTAIESVPALACTLKLTRERVPRDATDRPSLKLGNLYASIKNRGIGGVCGPAHTAYADARMAACVYARLAAFPKWSPTARLHQRRKRNAPEARCEDRCSNKIHRTIKDERTHERSNSLTPPPVPQRLHTPASAPLSWRDRAPPGLPCSSSKSGWSEPSTGGGSQ